VRGLDGSATDSGFGLHPPPLVECLTIRTVPAPRSSRRARSVDQTTKQGPDLGFYHLNKHKRLGFCLLERWSQQLGDNRENVGWRLSGYEIAVKAKANLRPNRSAAPGADAGRLAIRGTSSASSATGSSSLSSSSVRRVFSVIILPFVSLCGHHGIWEHKTPSSLRRLRASDQGRISSA
jgi:hypothetical protein